MKNCQWMMVSVLVLALLCSYQAGAELNLWISYHYEGVDAYEAGAFDDAETLLERAHDELDDDGRLAFTLDAMGKSFIALGRYEEAENILEEALELKADYFGEESRTVPATLNALGDLHYVADGHENAEAMYREALDMHDRDPYNVEACRSLNGLALLHAARDENVEAESLLQRAIKYHQLGGRRDHPYTATALTNLAILYLRLERYDEAEPLLGRAEYIQNKILPHSHPDAALRAHAQAELLMRTGRHEEALWIRDHLKMVDGPKDHDSTMKHPGHGDDGDHE